MSLMARLMAAKFKAAPVHPGKAQLDEPDTYGPPIVLPRPPSHVPTSAPSRARGSCKAINADTGRQCALLAGHVTAHRHGRTDFVRCAEPGTTTFIRRQQLDELAAASGGSPFTAGRVTG